MARFEKGSKEAQEWAKKMRNSRGKDKEVKDNKQEEIPKEIPKLGIYCPSCESKGKKVVMTNRGADTLVCPKCLTHIKNPNFARG